MNLDEGEAFAQRDFYPNVMDANASPLRFASISMELLSMDFDEGEAFAQRLSTSNVMDANASPLRFASISTELQSMALDEGEAFAQRLSTPNVMDANASPLRFASCASIFMGSLLSSLLIVSSPHRLIGSSHAPPDSMLLCSPT